MIEVKIPKDIKNYKEKFMLNLTIRQFLSFASAVFIMLPLFIVGVFKWGWNMDLVGWLVLLIGTPIIGLGFFNYHGMPTERFVIQWLKTNVLYPQKRIYRIRNTMKELINYVEPAKEGKKDNDEGKENKNSRSKNSTRHNSLPSDII
jgi:hypothetical protein